MHLGDHISGRLGNAFLVSESIYNSLSEGFLFLKKKKQNQCLEKFYFIIILFLKQMFWYHI